MAIYFHDRRTNVVHSITGPSSDLLLSMLPKSRMTYYSAEKLREEDNAAAAQGVQHALRYNRDMLLTGRSQLPKPTSSGAKIMNRVSDGEVLFQDYRSGGRTVPKDRLHYGFTEPDLKSKADKLERNAQAKGK